MTMNWGSNSTGTISYPANTCLSPSMTASCAPSGLLPSKIFDDIEREPVARGLAHFSIWRHARELGGAYDLAGCVQLWTRRLADEANEANKRAGDFGVLPGFWHCSSAGANGSSRRQARPGVVPASVQRLSQRVAG